MTRQTVTTVTREYDDEGRIVKEVTAVCEYDWPHYPATVTTPYVPYQPYWQTGYSSAGNVTVPSTITHTINGAN